MLNKYYELKSNYDTYLIFIKKGNFYYCYKEDAYIIHYLLNYKLIDNAVAFPLNAINKVLNIVTNNDLGVIIYDGIILDKIYGDSDKYNKLHTKSLEYIDKEKIIKNINEKLKSYTLEQLSKVVSTI